MDLQGTSPARIKVQTPADFACCGTQSCPCQFRLNHLVAMTYITRFLQRSRGQFLAESDTPSRPAGLRAGAAGPAATGLAPHAM
jgi:hypothetical protein